MEHIEMYWDFISCLVSIVRMGSTGLLFSYLVKPFLIKSKYAPMVGAVYFSVMMVLYLIPYEMDSMVAYAAGTAAALAVMYLIDGRNAGQKLYLAVIMYLLDWISHGIAVIFRSILFEKLINMPYIMQRPVLQLGCYVGVEIFYVILIFTITIFFIKIINKVYVRKKENMSKKELGLLLVTPLLALTGYGTFNFISNAYLADMEQYIWNIHSGYLWIQALYQIIAFLAIIVVILLYQTIKENHRKEKENAVLSEQMVEMRRYIREVETLYSDIRGLKHDMANHIMTLGHLFQKNEQQAAIEYLSRLKERLSEIGTEIKSGNPVTDVILTEKKKEAERKGIEFVCDFHYPEGTNINAFDVSIILNNAAGNAIEAAEKCNHPFVYMKSWRKKNVYMIEVRNVFTGSLVVDGESGLPESTKEGKEHGFGLANIRKIAQKYLGDIDIKQEGNEFVLSIMLIAES